VREGESKDVRRAERREEKGRRRRREWNQRGACEGEKKSEKEDTERRR